MQRSNLNSHMESVHEKKKPYKCEICDANFTEKQGMVSHTQSVHEGIKPFKCDICDATFTQKFHSKNT